MTEDGQASSAASAPVRAEGRRPRLGKLLVVVLAFLVALGAVAGGALLFLYDRATGIDRSTPQVVTRHFLDAALVLRDPERLSLFVCDSWSAAEAMVEVGAPADPGVIVSWGDSTAEAAGTMATTTVDVRFTVYDGNGLQEEVQTWTLRLENDDGWRVCGMEKSPSFEP